MDETQEPTEQEKSDIDDMRVAASALIRWLVDADGNLNLDVRYDGMTPDRFYAVAGLCQIEGDMAYAALKRDMLANQHSGLIVPIDHLGPGGRPRH